MLYSECTSYVSKQMILLRFESLGGKYVFQNADPSLLNTELGIKCQFNTHIKIKYVFHAKISIFDKLIIFLSKNAGVSVTFIFQLLNT